jgi:predicted AAA+ superfamily ATPase
MKINRDFYLRQITAKKKQEKRPLLKIRDSFRKIIVVKDNIKPYNDDDGIAVIGLKDFLLNDNSLDFVV